MKVLVTGFKAYSFQEKETGRQVAGTSMHYIDPEQVGDVGLVGALPVKQSVSDILAANLTKAPAIYEIDFSIRPDGRGRPQLQLSKIEYVKDFSFKL